MTRLKAAKLTIYITIAAIVVGAEIGAATQKTLFIYLLIAIALAGVIVYIILARCPRCGKYLGPAAGLDYCPHCGGRLER